MNRGVEIAGDVAERPNAVVTEQVANGVAVRMAVLFLLLGPGRHTLGDGVTAAVASSEESRVGVAAGSDPSGGRRNVEVDR
jgi:aspartate carbamoyltransferase catalytic subunit